MSPLRHAQDHPPLEAFENYVKGLVAVTPGAQQRFLELAFRQAPRDARILLAMSSLYAERGLHDKALAAARNVPAASPLGRKARFAASLSLTALNRWEEAPGWTSPGRRAFRSCRMPGGRASAEA